MGGLRVDGQHLGGDGGLCCARGTAQSLVLIPEGKIAWGKLAQAMDYGAVTCQLKTDFDGCVKVLTKIVQQAPIYLLNSVNPYRLEGQKTPAFEIAEAFDWTVPDHLIVPGGNLANSSALGKGFREMKELGLVARVPKISVIQAEGANPLVRSFATSQGVALEPVEAHTRATAIRIGNPASWRKAVHVIQETGGWCLDVTEAEIAIAKAELGAEGLGCEPASAVTLAGLKKLRAEGKVAAADTVVLMLTGHTLKDADYTIDFHRGTLLREEEAVGHEAEIAALRRNAVAVDATPEAVLAAMKEQARMNAGPQEQNGNAATSAAGDLCQSWLRVSMRSRWRSIFISRLRPRRRRSFRLKRRVGMRSAAHASRTI